MATATPVTNRNDETLLPAGPPSGTPSAKYSGGSKVIGALFYNNGSGKHYCTASIINAPKQNLLLTAAHCLYNPHNHKWNSNVAFVPGYSAGHRPRGVWPIWMMAVDKRWANNADADLDFGFAAVNGRIAHTIGYNTIWINEGFNRRVTVIGYPAKAHNPPDKPISCANTTFKQAKYQQGFDCKGFYGGTSGSPWMMNYNSHTQTGYVIGALGGYQEGGSVDWRSYAAVFDNDIIKLRKYANDCQPSHC
ncbi:hypothetical protein GCM10023196_007120 [Actinoallomurus vinaceus]|uniref:Peptidase S1 domain-containing protein n=2 Tax=Actinoallomurus vinaceus TaxID=1080074 RepID=A0ABP8U3P5_9ACTN